MEMQPDREQREVGSQALLGLGAEDVPTVKDPAGSLHPSEVATVPEDAPRKIPPLGIEVTPVPSRACFHILFSCLQFVLAAWLCWLTDRRGGCRKGTVWARQYL